MTEAGGGAAMPWWRAAGWSLGFLVLGLAFTILLLVPAAALMPLGLEAPLQAALVQAACMLAGFGAATWVVGMRANRLTPRDLRWTPPAEGVKGFGRGMLLGAAPAALALTLGVVAGSARWQGDGGGLLAWLTTVAGTGAQLLLPALAEELVFRGVPLVLLAMVMGRWVAGVALAGLFSLAHLANPGVTPLALMNIALAGVFLTACFYLPGGLWTATGAHLGWNLALAALAAPVSGIGITMPMLDYLPGGPAWLTGGGFGPEGGLMATLTLTIATLLVARRANQEPRS